MPLIDQASLLGIADRVSAQFKILSDAFDATNQTGGGLYYERVNATGDVDVQISLLKPYYSVDQGFIVRRWVQLAGNLPLVVSSMEIHFNAVGSVGGWDGYLSTHHCRVSDYFNQVYKIAKSTPLLATNVFCENDLVMGTAEVSDGPAIDFTDGDDFGPGMNPNLRADGGNFAAAQLAIKTVTTIGTSDLDLSITVKNWAGDPVVIEGVVPAGTLAGSVIPLGTANDRFMDVTGIGFQSGGSTGTTGDIVEIHNIRERVVAL
jgi:hypothetical protein